jgi:hypothetical protein
MATTAPGTSWGLLAAGCGVAKSMGYTYEYLLLSLCAEAVLTNIEGMIN